MRKSIKKNDRWYIAARFGKKCSYCGCCITTDEMHIDHYYPVSKERFYNKLIIDVNKDCNMMPSCRRCNMLKSNLTPEVFRIKLTNSLNGVFYFEVYLSEIKNTAPYRCIYPQKHKQLI